MRLRGLARGQLGLGGAASWTLLSCAEYPSIPFSLTIGRQHLTLQRARRGEHAGARVDERSVVPVNRGMSDGCREV